MSRTMLKRVNGLVWQEAFLTRRSLEMFFDILFFPMMNVILFGFIMHVVGSGSRSGTNLIMGILLWEVVVVNQYNLTVSSLWSVWSHNLTNIFIAPISISEYLLSHMLAAALRTAGVFVFLAFGTYFAFNFNITHFGIANLLLFYANLSLFAYWLGIILLGLIFRYGTRVQAIAWGTIFLFQPLSASMFPLSVLPHFIQIISRCLPATYVFEAARSALVHGGIAVHASLVALAMNVGYSLLAAFIFGRLFKRSKETGQFARNDL
ncbi:MAG TPA: ABC transporter permease [Candidatus Saccharimonadales bacterium]